MGDGVGEAPIRFGGNILVQTPGDEWMYRVAREKYRGQQWHVSVKNTPVLGWKFLLAKPPEEQKKPAASESSDLLQAVTVPATGNC